MFVQLNIYKSISWIDNTVICTSILVLGQLPPRKTAPIPKTLTQPLTLTGGQFSSGAIVWLPPNRKINPNLDPNPNPNRGAIFFGRQLSRYHRYYAFLLNSNNVFYKISGYWKYWWNYFKPPEVLCKKRCS